MRDLDHSRSNVSDPFRLLVLVAIGLSGAVHARGQQTPKPDERRVQEKEFDDSAAIAPKLIVTKGTALHSKISGNSRRPVRPYAIYFWLKEDGRAVTKDGDVEWVRVGSSPLKPVGWLRNEGLIAWKTRSMLAPKAPVDDQAVFEVYRGEQLQGARWQFQGGVGDSMDIAPILEPPDSKQPDVYHVAIFTGPVEEATGTTNAPDASPKESTALSSLKLEIVFVIDTTRSMTHLLEGTKSVIKEVVKVVSERPQLEGDVRFGLVEYQDATPGLKPSRVVSPLEGDPSAFQAKLQALQVSLLPSEETREDVLAGLVTAITQSQWSANSIKHIVLLGDASAHLSGPKNTTQRSFVEVINMTKPLGGGKSAQVRNAIYLHAIRALNPSDPEDSRECEKQFRDFAANQGEVHGLYLDLDPNDPASSRDVIGKLVEALIKAIQGVDTLRTKGVAEFKRIYGGSSDKFNRVLYKYATTVNDKDPDQSNGPAEPVTDGYATVVNKSGREVAHKKLLVHKDELQQLQSTLDFLYNLFKLRTDPDKRKDVAGILNALRVSAAAINAGQDVDVKESTKLSLLIKTLPLQNDALNLSVSDLAIMSRDDFSTWLEKIKAATVRAGQILDDSKNWNLLSGADATEKDYYSYLRIEELP